MHWEIECVIRSILGIPADDEDGEIDCNEESRRIDTEERRREHPWEESREDLEDRTLET